MSAPVRNDELDSAQTPTMYAPPWARDGARDAGDAGLAAVDKALNASEEFRRTLPPAAPLEPRRWREPVPFAGDVAARHLRARPTLDPVALAPPLRERGAGVAVLARVGGAVGLAALAALFVVGAIPQPIQAPQAAVTLPIVPAQELAFAERVAAVPAAAPNEQPVVAQPVPASPPAPTVRTLDRDEIAMLYHRSEELVAQGDIAAARLMLARAAEAGDARSALALGATYDPDVLRKLGVLGVAADAAQARAWYAKAAEYGSGEATRRLEQIAQSVR
jgi:hypothetical protein